MNYIKFEKLYKIIRESELYKTYFKKNEREFMDNSKHEDWRYNWLKWIKFEFNDDTKKNLGKLYFEDNYIGIQVYPYFVKCKEICKDEDLEVQKSDKFPYTKKEYVSICGNEDSGMDVDSKTGNIMKKDNKDDVQIMFYKNYKMASIKDDSLGLTVIKNNEGVDFKNLRKQYQRLMKDNIISNEPIDVNNYKAVIEKIQEMIKCHLKVLETNI